jgi:uncharacterized protein (TIGR03067 family)
MLRLGFAVMLVAAAGYAAPPKSDSDALQGKWKGQDSGSDGSGSASLVVTGAKLEFRGADTNEWYKATFTLQEDKTPKQLIAVVTESAAPQYVGKTAKAIYQIKEGKLTITAKEPGNPDVPTAFEGPDTRTIVFKREKP